MAINILSLGVTELCLMHSNTEGWPKHTYTRAYMYGVHTVLLAGSASYIWSGKVYAHGSGQTYKHSAHQAQTWHTPLLSTHPDADEHHADDDHGQQNAEHEDDDLVCVALHEAAFGGRFCGILEDLGVVSCNHAHKNTMNVRSGSEPCAYAHRNTMNVRSGSEPCAHAHRSTMNMRSGSEPCTHAHRSTMNVRC